MGHEALSEQVDVDQKKTTDSIAEVSKNLKEMAAANCARQQMDDQIRAEITAAVSLAQPAGVATQNNSAEEAKANEDKHDSSVHETKVQTNDETHVIPSG